MDFRYRQHFKAAGGGHGMGRNRTGAGGADMILKAPVGTQVLAEDKEGLVADLTTPGQRVLLAAGGNGGFGNAHFKGPVNQAPRHANPGLPGEERWLWLRLKLIADVGIIGLPNAGKSTFLAAASAARPKVADYPFTTLAPHLGVVSLSANDRFVMADIPGLIEGAAEGAGLGIRFLKHLQRTRVLLHLVDMHSPDPDADPVRDARAIVGELRKFSRELATKPRWLVINKRDLLPDAEAEQRAADIARRLRYRGPRFLISAASGRGTRELAEAVMRFLEQQAPPKPN
jgi:GTP-binding protein